MSLRHCRRVWFLDLSPAAMHVLHALAWLANDNDECWPSYAYLIAMTRCSQSTLQRRIEELVTRGYVEIVQRSQRDQPTRYRVHLDDDRKHELGGQDDHSSDPLGVQDDHSTAPNGWSKWDNGWSNCPPDPLKDPEDPDPPFNSPQEGGESPDTQAQGKGRGGEHQYPADFVYYFQSVYPIQDGMWRAYQVFKRHRLTQAQLEHMREVILWRRTHDPKWRNDVKGNRFILNPARFMRERQYGDAIPGRPPPCSHPSEQLDQDARSEWFCRCGHGLTPAEAEARGLVSDASADQAARSALAEIQTKLRRRG